MKTTEVFTKGRMDNKKMYIYHEYHLAVKRNEIVPWATWMDLEISEVREGIN